MVVSVHNSFQAKNYRVFRASLFAGLGLTGIVPVIHGWIVNYDIAAVHSALSLDVLMGVIYLVSQQCHDKGKFNCHSTLLFCGSLTVYAVQAHCLILVGRVCLHSHILQQWCCIIAPDCLAQLACGPYILVHGTALCAVVLCADVKEHKCWARCGSCFM